MLAAALLAVSSTFASALHLRSQTHLAAGTDLGVGVGIIGKHIAPVRVVGLESSGVYSAFSMKATPNGESGDDLTYDLVFYSPTGSSPGMVPTSWPTHVRWDDADYKYVGPLGRLTRTTSLASSSSGWSAPTLPRRRSGFVDLDQGVKDRTKTAVVTGRLARHESGKVTSTRTDELKGRMSSLLVDGGLATTDVLTAGSITAGTATVGALRTAHSLHSARKLGKGGKELVKVAASTGISQVSPWLGLIRDVAGIAQTMTPRSYRMRRKLRKATEFLEKVDDMIAELEELKSDAADHSLALEAARIQKAIDRLNDGKTAVRLWVSGKSTSGRIPLLAAGALQRLNDDDEFDGIL